MSIGVVFPQTEFPADPIAVRDYAQTVQALGYTHILAYDHVLGANPDRPGGWQGPYTHQDPFLEPLLLFSFMAAAAPRLEFLTGIIILPQRETALVAKQAAVLDVLCGGKLRLGVGIGWNPVEYHALNQDFHSRGRRIEEQISLMRSLWTQELVTFAGEFDQVQDAGLNPLPVQRPIPIWIGGYVDAVLRRIGRMGDGWLPHHRTPEAARADLDSIARYAEEAGRSPASIGLEPRLHFGGGDLKALAASAQNWQRAGATHLSINTMGSGFTTVQEHLQALRQAAEVLDPTNFKKRA
jgi:probable F420-dependent oxidoreductase